MSKMTVGCDRGWTEVHLARRWRFCVALVAPDPQLKIVVGRGVRRCVLEALKGHLGVEMARAASGCDAVHLELPSLKF